MEAKVASTSLQWSQTILPRLLSSYKLPSSISSTSLNNHSQKNKTLASCFVHHSTPFGSCQSRSQTLKWACTARVSEFSEEEFFEHNEESAQNFGISDGDDTDDSSCAGSDTSKPSRYKERLNSSDMDFTIPLSPLMPNFGEPASPGLGVQLEPQDWPRKDEIDRASIEWKANRIDIPLSIRIIKRKKQWEKGFTQAGDCACCSVKKAFSSMVFIIRELQGYTLQIREILYGEDLDEIMTKVQKEMHASFVWLFRQVFSQTPTLMIYVMILFANFTVCSMTENGAIAAPLFPRISNAIVTEATMMTEKKDRQQSKSDSHVTIPFSISSLIRSKGSDGSRVHRVDSGTEGGDWHLGRLMQPIQYPNVVPNETLHVSPQWNDELIKEEEASLWNSVIEEASKMQAELRGEILNHETMQRFVSPVSVKLEPDNYLDYFKTELLYHIGLAQDPNNSLLLSNYAQFLYLVSHDYDSAEECFKCAIQVEPPDADALSKYADFLWFVRKDLWGAEERYQKAMAAEPDNPCHASKYASFLWSTGGEDTCFPLSTSDDDYRS